MSLHSYRSVETRRVVASPWGEKEREEGAVAS